MLPLTAVGLLLLVPALAHAQAADSLTLRWTATGDDGAAGTAALYDLRMSDAAITATNWDEATAVAGVPVPAASGTTQSCVVRGLTPGATYYFALRVRDDAGNWSEVSNVVRWDGELDESPPPTPTGLAAALSGDGIGLTWDPSTAPDLAGYSVYRTTAESGPYVRLHPEPAAAPAYQAAAPPDGARSLWYRVTATDVSGNESAQSAAVAGLETSAALALAWRIAPVFPNPSHAGQPVTVPVVLEAAGRARLDFVDAAGHLVRQPEVEAQADAVVRRAGQRLERAGELLRRLVEAPLVEQRAADHLRGALGERRVLRGGAEALHRLVGQPHLPVGHAQIVVALGVAGKLGLDAALELREQRGEVQRDRLGASHRHLDAAGGIGGGRSGRRPGRRGLAAQPRHSPRGQLVPRRVAQGALEPLPRAPAVALVQRAVAQRTGHLGGLGVVAALLAVLEPQPEDLGGGLGAAAEVAVDEFAQADVVVHGGAATGTCHVEFEFGDAEGVLHVDQHQPGGGLVGGGRLKSVLKRPVPRLFGTFLVGDPPDGADLVRVKERGDGKFIHFVSFLIVYPCNCMSSVICDVDFLG